MEHFFAVWMQKVRNLSKIHGLPIEINNHFPLLHQMWEDHISASDAVYKLYEISKNELADALIK